MFLQIRRRIKLDGAELEEYVKRKQDQEQEDIRRKVELALKYVHLLGTRLPQLPPHPHATMTTDIKSLSPPSLFPDFPLSSLTHLCHPFYSPDMETDRKAD